MYGTQFGSRLRRMFAALMPTGSASVRVVASGTESVELLDPEMFELFQRNFISRLRKSSPLERFCPIRPHRDMKRSHAVTCESLASVDTFAVLERGGSAYVLHAVNEITNRVYEHSNVSIAR